MAGELHKTHDMVKELHVRFDSLDTSLRQLHTDHKELRERVDNVEKAVAKDVANLTKHEAEACLRESVIIQRLDTMAANQDVARVQFVKHADREDSDRRWLLGIVLLTLLSTIGTLFVMLFGG